MFIECINFVKYSTIFTLKISCILLKCMPFSHTGKFSVKQIYIVTVYESFNSDDTEKNGLPGVSPAGFLREC